MRFQTIYGLGNKFLCHICSSFLQPNVKTGPRRMLTSIAQFRDEDLYLFFNSEVQAILKQLTGYDTQKIFNARKLGRRLGTPEYKFMTSEQLEEAIEKSKKKAEILLQMPPVVPICKDIEVVLAKDPEIIGYTDSKYVFTDISFGKTDRTRLIVVREPDGTLRTANRFERRNANQAYLPRPGRQFRIPTMFQPEYLKPVLERGDYLFILDRTCVEFDPDEPEFHRVTQATYDHIDENQAYGVLRFTRHFGPMVFYFVLKNNIDNLLLENLKTNRIDDAAALVALYHIVHPSAKSAESKLQPGLEVAFVKEYIDKDAKLKVALDLAIMSLGNTSNATEEQRSLSN